MRDVQGVRAALFHKSLALFAPPRNVGHELLFPLLFLRLLSLEVALVVQPNDFCLLTLFENCFSLRAQLRFRFDFAALEPHKRCFTLAFKLQQPQSVFFGFVKLMLYHYEVALAPPLCLCFCDSFFSFSLSFQLCFPLLLLKFLSDRFLPPTLDLQPQLPLFFFGLAASIDCLLPSAIKVILSEADTQRAG
jgi:hypothetical protein